MENILEDCNCLQYNDKMKFIGSLYHEIDWLEESIITLNKTKGTYIKFRNEIIPEYHDLIKRIENTPDC